jgi:predicted homoserine dehydrogenase-like protein
MSLHRQLQQRAAEGRPIRVGLIGAGKFGTMYLAQVPRTPGVHLVAIADLSPERRCATWRAWAGRPRASKPPSIDAAWRDGRTHVGDDWQALVRHPAVEIVVECTGSPVAAVDHCLEAFAQGKPWST